MPRVYSLLPLLQILPRNAIAFLNYHSLSHALKRNFSLHVTPQDLHLWYAALSKITAPRKHWLPRGHPEGSRESDSLAMYGDALLKAAALKALGTSYTPSYSEESIPNRGELTSRLGSILSNANLAKYSATLLFPPSPYTSKLKSNDLKVLSTHGIGTVVETAIALVYAQSGPDPIDCLADFLVYKTEQIKNWKGQLLELGGTINTVDHLDGGFLATASVFNFEAKAASMSSKREAEMEAARLVLCKVDGAASESSFSSEPIEAPEGPSFEEAITTSMPYNLPFQRHVFCVEPARSLIIDQIKNEGVSWFLNKTVSKALYRLFGAPILFPEIVKHVCAWTCALENSDDDSGADEFKLGATYFALLAVILKEGDTTRWFFSGPSESLKAAEKTAALSAIEDLNLIPVAREKLG